MSENAQFCPQCGISLATASICPKCHWDPTQSHATPDADTNGSLVYGSGTWLKLEKPIGLLWPWLWRVTAAIVVVIWIFSLVRLFQFSFWNFIQFLLTTGAVMLFGLFYSRYANVMNQKEYNFLANDVFVVGNLRFPKILVIALGINLGLYLWGGLLILIPVVLFVIFSPIKIQWKVGKVVENEPKLPAPQAPVSPPSPDAET